MTTLRNMFMARATKTVLAALLVLSMVPVAAFASTQAFAEDAGDANTAFTEQVNDAKQASDQEESSSTAQAQQAAEAAEGAEPDPASDSGSEPEGGNAATSDRLAYAASADGQAETAEGAETEAATEAVEEGSDEGSFSDLQLAELETTVETPGWSLFMPLRMLFGATSTFTAPLASGNHEQWIDRLDLSEAPYGRPFYDVLLEGADNDGVNDFLIDEKYFNGTSVNAVNSNSKVGGVYKFSGTPCILAAIVDGNEDVPEGAASSYTTPTEDRIREYVYEVYGAFDRDCPTSFWRDISFGTVFWRNAKNQTFCGFALKSGSFDLRAAGYRSTADIKAGIATIESQASKIEAEFEASGAADTEYERVKFYNEWICKNNGYNSTYPNIDQAANPDVWSAMSALSGRSGATGPVCEGYSRGLKLLCDRAGIGCVLVDGMVRGSEPHMWTYCRVGSSWYAVDPTWNDTGSTGPFDSYLLVGSDSGFLSSHPVSNQFKQNGTMFTNGPQLAAENYDPAQVSFAGIITSASEFAYGDAFALGYNSTTTGTVAYAVVSGPAAIDQSAARTSGAADSESVETIPALAAIGSGPTLRITGLGAIKVRVTLTPASGTAKTDEVTITAVPRPLKVTGTQLASRPYDGTTAATVATAGQLVSARSESYASEGVLAADAGKLAVTAKEAAYATAAAGTGKTGTATYQLSGDVANLYTLASDTDASATGTVTKRPATAYFALSSTRMLLNEEAPTGTVRIEAFDAVAGRGLVEGESLVPTGTTIKLDGMPDPVSAGTYDITWAKPNAYVLEAINKLPAAANYDVALAEGAEDEPVQLEVVNLGNTVVVPAEGVSGGATYRVETRVGGINDDTVTKLAEADSGYTSVDGILEKLVAALGEQTSKLDANKVVVYDMTLYVADEKGVWVPATADNFPADGVRVTVDYPEGTTATGNSFYAAHMFTSQVTSGSAAHKPGEVEKPKTSNTDAGVSFTLMGFSPVTVAWDDTPPTTTAGGNGSGSGIGGGASSIQTGQSTANAANSGLTQTGDSILAIAVVAVVVVVCAGLIVFMLARRKKDKRS